MTQTARNSGGPQASYLLTKRWNVEFYVINTVPYSLDIRVTVVIKKIIGTDYTRTHTIFSFVVLDLHTFL